jgi:hypothetical protein
MNKLVRRHYSNHHDECVFLDNQGAINNDRINSLQLKEDLLTKETSLFQAQSIINELKKELEQRREEVILLLFFKDGFL